MTDQLDRDLAALARRTAPSRDAVARVHQRTRAAFFEQGLERARRQVQVLSVALAVAVLGVGVLTWRMQSTELLLDSPHHTTAHTFRDLSLAYRGSGSLRTSLAGSELLWQAGWAEVDHRLRPGFSLEVSTAEGRISSLGSSLTIERSELGTRIIVDRGEALVRCASGADAALAAGATQLCVRPRPEMLVQAAELREAGRWLDVVLVTEAALQGDESDQSWTWYELLAMRISALVALERVAEARGDLETYLAADRGPRQVAYRVLAVELAARASDCESVERHLALLAPDERVAIEGLCAQIR